MEHTKVSFTTTVFNEENKVEEFLDSIVTQTRMPDEVVIVDAGSSDSTLSIISNFQFPISNVKIITKKGNRSLGRNEAVKHAKHEIIVCSDVGCVLDKNWLYEITKPFEKNEIDVVSGFYLPITRNSFQKALASYTCVMPDRIDPKNFLPSSRSIAFKKTCWKKAGGYPENLDTCEDLVFAKKLKNMGFGFVFQRKALVYWYQKESFSQAFFQFYRYAQGDGQAHYFRPQTPLLFGRYIVGLLLFALFVYTHNALGMLGLILVIVLYFLWAIQKNYKYVQNPRAFYLLPVLQILADIAVLLGTTTGYFKKS